MYIMTFAIIFWSGLGVLAWTWAGYPAVLFCYASYRRPLSSGKPRDTAPHRPSPLPHITVIVPVHNEELALPGKINNCLSFDYPDDRIEVIIASDGSSDSSPEIVRRFGEFDPRVRLVESSGRAGKSSVQNLAAAAAVGDILLLTDVDALLPPDAPRLVAGTFRDQHVGCVTGRVVWQSSENSGRAQSENLYWRFEHGIWARETAIGTLACASGPCMAIRRSLFHDIDPRFGDDVVLPLDVLRQGSRVAYEPALTALEISAANPGAALRARARMTLRSLEGTISRMSHVGPFRQPLLFVTILSHKLLRWATPVLVLAVLAAAIPLALTGQLPARTELVLQGCWLIAAVTGHVAERLQRRIPIAAAAYDLSVENLGILMGVTKAVLGRREIAYRPRGQ
jgi:Glycosyl transferase family 2